MVEVIVSAVIFAIAVSGFLAMTAALRQPSADAEVKLRGAYIGKRALEELHALVNPGNWADDGGVGAFDTTIGIHNYGIVGIYNVTYTVSNVANSSAKRIDLTVTWPD